MKIRRLVVLVLILSLTGCSQRTNSYESLESLRDAFVKSGGQCWEWKVNEPYKSQSTADCDSKTVLILFAEGTDALKEAISFADFNRNLSFKVNLLVGENWMINSDQVTLVAEEMGGTLITR